MPVLGPRDKLIATSFADVLGHQTDNRRSLRALYPSSSFSGILAKELRQHPVKLRLVHLQVDGPVKESFCDHGEEFTRVGGAVGTQEAHLAVAKQAIFK